MLSMNINDQTDTFQYELAKLIYRFKSEYDINDYTIAGCLDFCKLSVLTETDDVIFTGEITTEDIDNEEDTKTATTSTQPSEAAIDLPVIKIVSEEEELFVKMELEMEDETHDMLVKWGKEVASDEDYINIAIDAGLKHLISSDK